MIFNIFTVKNSYLIYVLLKKNFLKDFYDTLHISA